MNNPPVKIVNKDIGLWVSDNGIIVQIEQIEIPIPDSLLSYLIENPYLMIYFTDPHRYLEESYITIKLNTNSLLEARGAWEYRKSLLTASG